METVIGIDLGTTNSSVTAVENGKIISVKNKFGNEITPSAVYFGKKKGEILVGKEAKEKSRTDPKNLVLFVKREMGKAKEKVRHNKIEDSYSPYEFWGKIYSPEEISAMILKQLKKDAEKALGKKVSKAIITCPAYFGDAQKTATKNAGRIAGLDVIEVLPEPTAASLCYTIITNRQKENVLVFDLGGGTFDVTILEIDKTSGENDVKTISTDGDAILGGKDWDDVIISFMIDRFNLKFNTEIDYGSEKEKNKTYGMLRLEVEKAKINLFKENNTSVDVQISYGGKTHTENISRQKYAELTKEQTSKCETYCNNTLRQAEMTWDDIDTVLMIGNMSNCIFIQDALKEWSGKNINFGIIDPKTCVSKGAAIRASGLLGENTVDDVVFAKNLKCGVLPSSIGVKGHTRNGEILVKQLLKKNLSYPTEVTQDFSIENTQLLEIEIMEGESSDPYECDLLGKMKVHIDGKMSASDKLTVKLLVDKFGILQVEASNKTANIFVRAEIKRENEFSDEEIQVATSENDDFILG